MVQSGAKSLRATLVAVSLVGAGILAFVLWYSLRFPRRDTITELEKAQVNSAVHLVGVVTFCDGPQNRFWLEDETGAVAIPENPEQLKIHSGQTIAVDAIKTMPYDSSRGSESLGLKVTQVRPASVQIKLSPPSLVTVSTIPGPEKSGIRIRLAAVVQSARSDPYGRVWLSLAGSGTWLSAGSGTWLNVAVAQPTGDYSNLVNATVELTGVIEQTRNSQGVLLEQHLWVASGDDLHIEQAAPEMDPLYTVRDIYARRRSLDGHRIRLRGTVAAVLSDSILLEDSWGMIECHMDKAPPLRPESTVEIAGFPDAEDLGFDLFYSHLVQTLPGELGPPNGEDGKLKPLTTVKAVRDLPVSEAVRALPARISGVITFHDPLWHQLFIQDKTGGIYMKYSGPHADLHPGVRVTVIGITGPGDFAPVVLAPKFHVEGAAPLPVPIQVTLDQAKAGLLDSLYATIEGVAHPLRFGELPDHPAIDFELFSTIGSVHVATGPGFPDLAKTHALDDARIRIRGVFGTIFNSRRQLVGFQILASSPSDIDIIEPAVSKPFAMDTTPVGSLLGFTPEARVGHRVKVSGTVTAVGRDSLYLQDQTGGVEILGDARAIHVGEQIEALGYPDFVGKYSPVLSDAQFRSIPGAATIFPKPSTADSVANGTSDSQLVAIEGRLLSILPAPDSVTYVLQSGSQTFTAQLDTTDLGAHPQKLREGSILRLTGIASAQINPNNLFLITQGVPTGFTILLRTEKDILVIRPAPFWTPQKTLVLLALSFLLIVIVLFWVEALRRRIRRQDAALEKAKQTAQAIHDLSSAMHEVSKEEKFDTQVSVQGNEEIAQLVVSFNRMLSQLLERDCAKREAEAKLQHQALFDDLTGLPNRRLLTDRLSQGLATARRENHKIALLYIDLDGFKLVNDSFGHAAGDLVLIGVAQRLKSRIREADTLARIGGDEFTVLLTHIGCKEDAEKVAEQLLEGFGSPFTIEGHEITIGASVGISTFPDHESENDDLLQQADTAMYQAKKQGKNRVFHFNNSLSISVKKRLILENELREALASGHIQVHYQPEFDLATKSIVRFEALARWTHPKLGAIPPLSFIPVAEESGLIFALGRHVLDRASRDALSWQAIPSDSIQVAVNVSSVEFARESFVDEIADSLQQTGLPPNLLQLELTESATLIGIDRAAATMRRLKGLGISIVMDDFGSGYSCLSYLPKLPFDALKVDRSFVSQLLLSAETKALIRSIIILAKNLGMRVIVEGIEKREQLELVSEMGAHEAQGYLLGRPTHGPANLLRRRGDYAASDLLEETKAIL